MLRFHPIRGLITIVLALAATSVVPAHASDAQPTVTKASDWLGHVVVTRDGKELGTVRDFAIDDATGKVVYVVVSVGSFLIENNLIAVAPDALVRARTEDGVLQLQADPNTLREVKRFASDGRWPAAPGVVRTEGGEPAAPAEIVPTAPTAAAPPPTGTATIESRSKTAHLSASERVITDTAPPPAPPPAPGSAAASKTATAGATARPPPITQFDRLDKDGDGVLNRSEFAPVISPKDSYSKIDTNANGVIEPQEFDAYERAHGGAN
jgi:sporulation protein YlmC with PRC-barrel domain